MLIGYARVSTQDQNLELQRQALQAAGCAKVYEDAMSGLRADRPGLALAMEQLREGDTLVVWKLDRLGRSVKGLVDLVESLQAQGIQFRSLTDAIDTSTPSGRFFFHVMASLAQMERELIAERTKAGLAAARKAGRVGGRKRSMTPAKIEAARTLMQQGTPAKDAARLATLRPDDHHQAALQCAHGDVSFFAVIRPRIGLGEVLAGKDLACLREIQTACLQSLLALVGVEFNLHPYYRSNNKSVLGVIGSHWQRYRLPSSACIKPQPLLPRHPCGIPSPPPAPTDTTSAPTHRGWPPHPWRACPAA